MRYARIVLEIVHLLVGLLATAALFWAGTWAYPQGAPTIRFIGLVTMVAVVALSIPAFLRAWRQDRAGVR